MANMEEDSDFVETLKSLAQCPVCLEIPRSGKFYLCTNSHSICGNCYEDLRRSEGSSLILKSTIYTKLLVTGIKYSVLFSSGFKNIDYVNSFYLLFNKWQSGITWLRGNLRKNWTLSACNHTFPLRFCSLLFLWLQQHLHFVPVFHLFLTLRTSIQEESSEEKMPSMQNDIPTEANEESDSGAAHRRGRIWVWLRQCGEGVQGRVIDTSACSWVLHYSCTQ